MSSESILSANQNLSDVGRKWIVPNIKDSPKVTLIISQENDEGEILKSKEYTIPLCLITGEDNISANGERPNYYSEFLNSIIENSDDERKIELNFKDDPDETFAAYDIVVEYIITASQLRDSENPELVVLENSPYKEISRPLELLPCPLKEYMEEWQLKLFGDAYSDDASTQEKFMGTLLKVVEVSHTLNIEWVSQISHAIVLDLIKSRDKQSLLKLFSATIDMEVPDDYSYRPENEDEQPLDMSIDDSRFGSKAIADSPPASPVEDEYGASGSGVGLKEGEKQSPQEDEEESEEDD